MSLSDGFYDVPSGKIAMVVTHLEMTTKHLRGAALPDGLTFTKLPRDLDTYRAVFRKVGQTWLWFGRLVMPDAQLEAILSDPNVLIFTLEQNGEPEALLELDFRTPGECELAYFGLSEVLIGSGAGAYLMDRAQEAAFKATIERFHVHTCTLDSPQALSFYIRSGFKPTRRQIEIADDPRTLGVHPKTTNALAPLL